MYFIKRYSNHTNIFSFHLEIKLICIREFLKKWFKITTIGYVSNERQYLASLGLILIVENFNLKKLIYELYSIIFNAYIYLIGTLVSIYFLYKF